MKVIENVTLEKVYCDVKGCKEKHVILNKKLDKDYCYQHAKDNHICEFKDKYQLRDRDDVLFIAEKITKCIEFDTICRFSGAGLYGGYKKYQHTYSFSSKEELAMFIFKMCEKNNWVTNIIENYGEKEIELNHNLKDFKKILEIIE